MKKLYLLLIAFCCLMLCASTYSAKAAPLSAAINPTDTVLYVCQNNELLLNAIPSNGQAPYSYLWTGDVVWLNQTNSSNVSFVCNIPGTYKLKVKITDNLLDEAYDSVKIIVKPLPSMSISGDQDICQGSSASMSASGPATIIWFDALDNLIGWGGAYSASPASTTFYTVMGISNGCSVSQIINVNVTPSPIVNAGADASICEGSNYSISDASASAYSTLLWNSSGDGVFSDVHAINPTYSPGPNDIANGSVILTLTLDAMAPCADMSDALTLTINPLPNIIVSNDTSVCVGFSATLSATGADSFIWSTGEITSTIVVSPASSTLYSITGTSLGCSSVESVLVDVIPFPVLIVSNDTTICESSPIALSASGATTYDWSNGSHSSSININPSTSSTYSVTGYNGACSTSASINVSVISLPVSAGSDQTICEGESAILNVVGGNSWVWSTGEVSSTINVSPNSTTTYQVTATDGICSNTDEVKIYVTPLPLVEAGDSVSICPGLTVQLEASGADSYIWNNGVTSNFNLVSPTISTTYFVTGTLLGCSAIDSVRVTVNDSILAEAGPDVTICLGQSALLTASGGDNFLWENGETTSSISVSPNTTTVYSVIVSKNGCVGIDSVSVFVNSLPSAEAGANDSVCVGQSLSLTASGGIDYLWSTGDNTASITVSPVSSTQYFVTVSDGFCSAIDSVFVTAINYPIVNLGNDTLVCIGTEIALNVSGGTSYLWNTGCIAASIIDYPIDTTQYSVTVTYHGCSSSDTLIVNTIPAIIATISDDDTICVGNSSTLAVGGGDSYLWSTGETTPVITVSPLSSTSYWVTVTQGACSTWVNTDVFVQTSFPLADAGIDQTICLGDSATLAASGGVSYFWDNGSLSSSITVSPLDTTMYHVIVSDGICSALDSVRINVNTYPIITLDTALWICPGTIAFLSAGGADTYLWSTGETTPDIYPTPDADTVYSVSGTSNGCTSTASIPVYHFGLPNVFAGNDVEICYGESATLIGTGDGELVWETGLINDTLIISPDSSLSIMLFVNDSNACVNSDTINIIVHQLPEVIAYGDTVICQGAMVPVWVSGAESYLWSNGEVNDSLMVNPAIDDVFFVTGTDSFGCSNTDSVVINVLPTPVAFAGNDTIMCSGSNLMLTASGGIDYLWNTGASTASIIVHPVLPTMYMVTVSNGLCSDVDTVIVSTNPLPSLDAGSSIAILEGDTASLLGEYFSSTLLADISWSPAAFTVDSNLMQAQIFPDTSTMFYFSLTDVNGCTGIDSVFVEVWPYGIYLIPGTDTIICSGSELTLYSGILMGGTAPFQYEWSCDTLISSSDSSFISIFPQHSSDVVLTVTDVEGYSSSTTYHITTIKTPSIQIPDSISTCRGNSVNIISNSIGDHQWSIGSNISSVEFIPDSSMTLILSVNNLGCVDFDSTIITVLALPTLSINQPDTVCNGDSVILIAHSDGELLWENGSLSDTLVFIPESSFSISVQAELNGCFANGVANILVYPNPTLEITTNTWENEFVDGQIIEITVKPDNYSYYSLYYGNDMYGNQSGIFNLHPPFIHDSITVKVISDGGCSADTTWQIALRKIPNGFTPNSDGVNDVFMPGTELTIINRWGQEVFSGIDGWDGKVNGEMSTPGTYYYIIIIRDEFGNVLDKINGDLLLIKQN